MPPQRKSPEIPQEFHYEPGRIEFRPPDLAYLGRMEEWLRYLGIQEGMGFDPHKLQKCTRELPGVLTELNGENSGHTFYGEAYEDGTRVVQPEYAGVLAHEMIHGKWEGALDEGAAVALGIYGFGAEKEITTIVYGNGGTYNSGIKRFVAVVNEATFMDGRHIFGLFEKLEKVRGLTFPQLLTLIDKYLAVREEQFNQSDEDATDYLVDRHRLTRRVANMALETTGLTKENIFRNNCEMLKLHIGAFKQLVTFYHINLGLRLDKAIRRVEEMFEKGEAIDIASSLHEGAQRVHSMLREANCDPNVHRMISQMMIENGADWASCAMHEIPAMLSLAGKYGPRGAGVIRDIMNNPAMLEKLVLGKVFSRLLRIHEGTQGERARNTQSPLLILERLKEMEWGAKLSPNLESPLIGWYDRELRSFSREERAQIYALMAYLDLEQPEEKPFPMINSCLIVNAFVRARENGSEGDIQRWLAYRGPENFSDDKGRRIEVASYDELKGNPMTPAEARNDQRPTSAQRAAALGAVNQAIATLPAPTLTPAPATLTPAPAAPPTHASEAAPATVPPQGSWLDRLLKKIGI